jgi:hypothetical protein
MPCAARALWLVQSEKQTDHQGNAENAGNKPEQFDIESPLFWVKWHAPSLAAVGRQR